MLIQRARMPSFVSLASVATDPSFFGPPWRETNFICIGGKDKTGTGYADQATLNPSPTSPIAYIHPTSLLATKNLLRRPLISLPHLSPRFPRQRGQRSRRSRGRRPTRGARTSGPRPCEGASIRCSDRSGAAWSGARSPKQARRPRADTSERWYVRRGEKGGGGHREHVSTLLVDALREKLLFVLFLPP